MVRVCVTFALLLVVHYSFSQVTDAAPSGNKNILAVEGGSRIMKIDSTTSLDSLIGRLKKKWRFVDTGKLYWIGYTADMYSIAARGDEAIDALTAFLKDPGNKFYSKYGAIHCLHLIGINSRIAGRFYEEFVNPKARIALLKFLKDTLLQEDIMRLLIRDPWPSDIPYIMDAMETCETDCWPLVNALARYKIKDLPILQKIPTRIEKITVRISYSNPLVIEGNFDFDAQIKEALDSFRQLKSKYVVIENALFNSVLIGDYSTKIGTPVSIQGFVSSLYLNDYCTLGTRVQYYVDGDKLYFCSPETARQRVLSWWKKLKPDERASYERTSR